MITQILLVAYIGRRKMTKKAKQKTDEIILNACNLCGKEIELFMSNKSLINFSACSNPECPNYALVQTLKKIMEKMKDE